MRELILVLIRKLIRSYRILPEILKKLEISDLNRRYLNLSLKNSSFGKIPP